MKTPFLRSAATAAAFIAISLPVQGHVTLENAQAAPDSTYKAVLRISHGCQGEPTRKVRVRIPEGIIAVKPMPKAGWTLETVKGPYVRAYDLEGEPVAEGVTGIVWSGTLEDGHYDEFVFQARITNAFQPGATIYFPVLQECAGRSEEWTEVPTGGQDAQALAFPAPGLRIVAVPGADAPSIPAKAEGLAIEQPWSRATPGGAKVGGGYVRITNNGQNTDRLIGASVGVAGQVQLHEMAMDGDIARMKPVTSGIEIKPGATVELKPGGHHLMFMDLKEPLKEGQMLKGSLVFEKAGRVEVEFTVRALGSQAPAASGHKH